MTVSLIALPRLDFSNRICLDVPEGCSIVDMIVMALPELRPHQYGQLRIMIDDVVILPAAFRLVRPKAGTHVSIRFQMHGGALKQVLSIAVTVAAIAVGQFYVGPLLAEAAGFAALGGAAGPVAVSAASSAFYGGVASGVLAVGSSLLLNALIPTRPNGQAAGGDKSLQSIQGLQNNLSPNGSVPQLLGFFRYAPDYICRPRTEIVGNDQYVMAGFLWGHGRIGVYDLKLGETPIDDYIDVQHETFEGVDGDGVMQFCLRGVSEESLGIQLTQGVLNTRITGPDISAFSFDLLYPQGLVWYNDKGTAYPMGVDIVVRYRLVGTVEWTEAAATSVAAYQNPIRRTFYFEVPTRGRYEVSWQRATADFDQPSTRTFARSDLTLLRSHRPEYPVSFKFPVAITDLRIRASDQLNGVVNNLNALGKSYVLDFDADEGEWVYRESNNPASLFRHILQGDANAFPTPDDGIALADLESWHSFCVEQGLHYNALRDSPASLLDTLADVASAGRATPQIIGGKWTVVVDRPQDQVIGAITPRNSTNFKGTITYPTLPDAFRVSFFDEENGYQSTERIIPFPGVALADVRVTEELSLPGKTNAAEVYREAYRYILQAKYLRESFSVTQDMEALIYTRGDLADLSHDVIDRMQASGRITSIMGDLISLDEVVTFEAGVGYAVHIRKDNGVVVQLPVCPSVGEMGILQIDGDLTGVKVGDLVMFGPTTSVTTRVRIKAIDRGKNLSASLTLIPYKPEIDAELADLVIPAWDGRFGEVLDPGPPGIPEIESIRTVLGLSSDEDDDAVTVLIGLSASSGPSPVRYRVAHRLVGGSAFTETEQPASSLFTLTGYDVTDVIEFKVRAVGLVGALGNYSDLETYIVHLGLSADNTTITADDTTTTADTF